VSIDPEAWWQVWERKLCKRFNREADQEEASDYLEYLEQHGLDTATALAAASQVWATREFFPRPADFIANEAAVAWPVLIEMAKLGQHSTRKAHDDLRAQISDRAWEAIRDLGGTVVIRDSRDLLRTRTAFQRSFEAVVIRNAQQLAAGDAERRLGLQPEERRLAPGGEVGVDVKVKPGKGPARVGVGMKPW